MQFKAPGDEPMSITLTSGHTAVVSNTKHTELEQRFHREAIARGCMPKGVKEVVDDQLPQFDRKKAILDAIDGLMETTDEANFTGDGKPNATKLSEIVGFTVSSDERNTLWDEYSKAK